MKNKILILPSNICFDGDNGKNILDAALESSIVFDHSCKTGDCRTCAVDIVSGEVINEQGQVVTCGTVLSCCSFAQSDVVLRANYYPELSRLEKKTLPCKVYNITAVTSDIIVVTLRTPPSHNFDYLAGQYINLTYKGVQRSYSIANAQHVSDGIELHIRKIPEGIFSELFFSDIKINTLLHAHGPHGTFFVRNTNAPIIFIAGGTGFAPIKAMVEELLEKNSVRDMYIYWGMPVSQSFYTDIASTWALKHQQITYVPVVSEPEKDHLWVGRTGFVHTAILDDFADLHNYEVYACGSLKMIDVAKQSFLAHGLDAGNFHSDAFIPAR